MDNGYEKEEFTTITFKASVTKKFRVFSKKMRASNSMTLLMMLDFFEINNVYPKESIGPTIHTLENLIKKRKASYQKLEQKVIHKFKMPNLVKTGEKKRFVYVLSKFVLGDNEKLEIEFKELKRSRKIVLKN
ncbi:BfmA/BtgA family mobilization protein [Aquimarina algiphila]|uniref:BfmA/BtgA family mobilization protein n=1 Tax=Aquimarina algiphila TaxID=2047982 RepID=UPI0023314B38|nr:BfmA/BtgA family mobilization protein [Aquimarina algiphila]